MSMTGKEMKICLPLYKVLYSLAFVVILSLARGVTQTYEVGIACEAPMALLSSVFCADTYVQEITSRRSEVWRLYPMKRKAMCIARRIGIQQCWLLLLGTAGYGMFFLFQDPFPLYSPGTGGESELHLFLVYLAVILVTLNFWGILGNMAACLTRSMWAGIGVCLALWLTVNSTTGDRMLGPWNLFSYTFRNVENSGDLNWIKGKALCICLCIIMAIATPKIIRKRG